MMPRFGMKLMAGALEDVSCSLQPRPQYGPFLKPNIHVQFKQLPPSTDPGEYLDLVSNNILVEYKHFLEQTFPQQMLVIVRHCDDGLGIASLLNFNSDGEEVDNFAEFHSHLIVFQGHIHISLLTKEGSLVLKQGDPWTRSLPPWKEPMFLIPPEYKHGEQAYDLGYIGDFINELSAAKQLAKSAAPRLLTSIANPRLRQKVCYEDLGLYKVADSVPINDQQLRVLQGLSYDIECIQGPPGTGKSTIIYHIIRSFLPTEGVALATCVQNKAVDAIADKLARSRDVPFFVHGNKQRLGLLAKEWTLEAQMLRDARVVVLSARLGRVTKLHSLLSKQCSRLLLLDNSEQTSVVDRSAGSNAKDRARASWRRLWYAHIKQAYPVLFYARKAIGQRQDALGLAKVELSAEVTHELIRGARTILCTVATASRSLLTDDTLEPAVSRIASVVLDEAGTCPESKLPLLSLLPHLSRIISIGDHKQLSPFTYIQPGSGGNGGRGGGGRGGRGGRVCTFFERGTCRKGKNCSFEHPRSGGHWARSASSPGTEIVEQLGFFQRVEKALPPAAIPSLVHQYRMHPSVCQYISTRFYAGSLRTPPEVASERTAVDSCGMWWVDYATSGLSTDFEQSPERKNSKSKVNPTEARLVVEIVQALALTRAAHLRAGDDRGTPGQKTVMVVTFYKAQDALLKELLTAEGIQENTWLRVLTADQSQGSEADVVILSCVRSNLAHKLGFLSNPNRLNVAVSRTRERLVVVGDSRTLATDGHWRALDQVCTHVGGYSSVPPFAK